MKTKYFIYPFLILSGLWACTPDDEEYIDFTNYEVEKIELGADHQQLIADGISILTLNPMIFQSYLIGI